MQISIKFSILIILFFIKSLFFQSECAKMNFCALNEKIEDFDCKLTGKKCGENMEFVTVDHCITKIFRLSAITFREVCVQQCKCARNLYEKDGKCSKNSTEISRISKALSFFTILDIFHIQIFCMVHSFCNSL